KEYIGRVVTVNSDDLALTGTDFCVFMRIPKADGLKRNSQLFKNMPMKVGTVSLEINLDPLEREIDATNEMMESEAPFHREFLDHILDLPSGTVVNVTDLSKGPSKPPSKYAMKSDNSPLFDTLADIIKGILNNAAQAAIVDGLKTVEGRYMGVIGPSGTGKTSVIKYVVWLLVAVGHKIAVCAPSNQALDHVTRSLNDTKRYLVGKHPEFANALKGKEMCRLEIGSIERMRMRHGDVGDDVTWTNRPTDSTIDSMVDELVWSDPRVQEAANLLAEFAGDAITEAEFDDFVGGYTTMRSIQAESEMRRARRPEVPYECTLGYWINTHCKEDEAKAREAYDQEKSRFGGIFHEGDNPDVAEHNPSDTYNGWKYEFLSREGKLNSEEMKQFRLARQQMEQRVMDRMSILVVTLSSAKSEHTAGMGFKATAIIVDEAAQASFSSLFVAMTAFPEADGIVMFGDPLQLKPFAVAKAATEVRGFAEESPLQRARTRKGSVRYLTVQYRMAPSIGEFPSKHFYEGKMIPHDNAKLDNPIRKCVRELSKESYGIGGQNGYGSECFMVSIERGFARLEPRGTSLQNHGNADAICLALDRLLAKGVPAREIGIITLYKAQMKVIASRIGKTNDGQAKYGEMSTVDAFQGREKSIILLDLVVGKSYESYDTAGKYDEGPSDDDIEAGEIAPGSAGRKYNFITAFARDPHRLCVALTRAMDGFIVFGQQASLLELGRRAKKANPLA
ncbi:MAG: hypothetical protein L6R35_007174, partial [Caloplaca aegaea]